MIYLLLFNTLELLAWIRLFSPSDVFVSHCSTYKLSFFYAIITNKNCYDKPILLHTLLFPEPFEQGALKVENPQDN